MNAKRRWVRMLLPIGAFALAPASALAANFNYFQNLVVSIDYSISLLFPVVVSLALLYFFWGLAKFIGKSGDDKAIAEGRMQMVWGVVALFVIVSVWGIVGLLGMIFGVGSGGAISPPGVADEDGETIIRPHF